MHRFRYCYNNNTKLLELQMTRLQTIPDLRNKPSPSQPSVPMKIARPEQDPYSEKPTGAPLRAAADATTEESLRADTDR